MIKVYPRRKLQGTSSIQSPSEVAVHPTPLGVYNARHQNTLETFFKRSVLTFASLLFLNISFAQEPVTIVHCEKIQAGPYQITVGFSEWPVQAGRSLDVLFSADGGVEDKTGTLTLLSSTPQTFNRLKRSHEPFPLERHPSVRESWGLDVFAFPSAGQWKFQFEIDGPQGKGEGSLAVVMQEPPTFLPRWISWIIALAPLLALLTLIVIAWRQDKPNHQVNTWSWV